MMRAQLHARHALNDEIASLANAFDRVLCEFRGLYINFRMWMSLSAGDFMRLRKLNVFVYQIDK